MLNSDLGGALYPQVDSLHLSQDHRNLCPHFDELHCAQIDLDRMERRAANVDPISDNLNAYPLVTRITTARRAHLRKQVLRIEQLAASLLEHYHCEGPPNLLLAVIHLCRLLLDLAILSYPTQVPVALARLGDALFALHELRYDLDVLKDSIRHYKGALGFSQSELSASLRCDIMTGLAYALYHRFLSLSCDKDYITAVDLLETAQCCLAKDDAQLNWVITVMSFLKGIRLTQKRTSYQCSPNVIHGLSEKLERTSTSRFVLSRSILALVAKAVLARTMVVVTQQHDYLQTGIVAAEKSVELCPVTAPVIYHLVLVTLNDMHSVAYYYRNPARIHLSSMIEIGRRLQLNAQSTWSTFIYWNSLYYHARGSLEHAVELNNLDIMEEAIDALKEAIDLCPPSHVMRLIMAAHLSYALGLHFDQSGRVGVLNELIALGDRYPEFVMQEPVLAVNIADAMLSRARLADSATSVSLVNRAIQLCQLFENRDEDRHPLHARDRSALNMVMVNASRTLSHPGYAPVMTIEEKLEIARRGISRRSFLIPTERIRFVLALTEALIEAARIQSSSSYLEEAMEVIEQELTTDMMSSSIYCVDLLTSQADILIAQFDLKKLCQHSLSDVWTLYHRAVSYTATYGRATERFQTCLKWASHANTRGHVREALRAYSYAMETLSQVVFFGEDIMGRMDALRQVSGLATASVSTALTLGELSIAINFLEQTRGITWSQLFQKMATDISSLSDIQREITNIGPALENADDLSWTARRHAAIDMTQALLKIREQPGFERFLLPPSLEELDSALKLRGGYLVVILPTKLFCDVVVFGASNGPFHHRLSTTIMERVHQLSHIVVTPRRSASLATNINDGGSYRKILSVPVHPLNHDPLHEVLSELWTLLVHPILKLINIQSVPDGDVRQRLWWCPIGILSSLPVHAAGIYEGSSQDHIGRYVISSYTPTLTALHRILGETSNPSSLRTVAPNVLLVAQPVTTTQPILPNTQVEIDIVRAIIPAECTTNPADPQGVSVSIALDDVKNVDILHLACHGNQDQDNPLNSGFELRDGRLTIGQLMQVRTLRAQLAYLSACDSASIDESRPDECLNLVGTMLFVGFKSAVGTMWAMDDVDGPFMAKTIYSRIFRDSALDLSLVPAAVDNAVRELRESGVPTSRWATFVHFGV